MLWVIVTFVVLLAVSVLIIAAVAVPRLRQEGYQLIPARGEEALREARVRLTNTSRR
jgi:hypothetical protein